MLAPCICWHLISPWRWWVSLAFHFFSYIQFYISFSDLSRFCYNLPEHVFSNKKNPKQNPGNMHLFIIISVTYVKNTCGTRKEWERTIMRTVLWSEYWSVPSSVDSERHQSAETVQRAERSKRQSGSSFRPWREGYQGDIQAMSSSGVRSGRRPAKFWLLTRAHQLSQHQAERRAQISGQLRHSVHLAAGPVARNHIFRLITACSITACLITAWLQPSAISLFKTSVWLRLSALRALMGSVCKVAQCSCCTFVFVLSSCAFFMLTIMHT